MGFVDFFKNKQTISNKQIELFKLLYIMEAYSLSRGSDEYSIKLGNIEKKYVENLNFTLEDFVKIINPIHEKFGLHWKKFGEGKIVKDIMNEEINIDISLYSKDDLLNIIRSLILIMFVDKEFNKGEDNNAQLYIIEKIGLLLGIDDFLFRVEAFIEGNYHRNLPEMTLYMHIRLFLNNIL